MKHHQATDEDLLQGAYRYAMSLSGRHHDAQDLAQQAAFKLIRRYGSLKNRSLVFKTVRNLYIDKYRRTKGKEVVPLHDAELGNLLAFESGPDQGDKLDLAHVLSLLDFEERELLYLHYVEGYTAAEIGTLLETSRNTILSRLSRTRKKARVLLSEPEHVQNHSQQHPPQSRQGHHD